MEKTIEFELDDGSTVELSILEQTRINGVNYILVAESDDEDAECMILKDTSSDDETEAAYEAVEDEDELDALAKIFTELLDDVTIES